MAECAREQLENEIYGILNQFYQQQARKIKIFSCNCYPQNLNASQLSLCFATQRYQEQIQLMVQAAVDVGIRGTPGFLLGFLQADGQVKRASSFKVHYLLLPLGAISQAFWKLPIKG
ncbi:MAG: hypothetical protein R2865_16770 [Deinococcales bacterium]